MGVNDEEGYSLVNDFRGDCLSVFDPQGNKVAYLKYPRLPRGIILDPILFLGQESGTVRLGGPICSPHPPNMVYKSGSLYVATNGTILFSV